MWTWPAWGLGGLAIVVLGVVYVSFLAGRWWFVPRFPDEIHFGRAKDDWRIAVLRYRPAGDATHRLPVLLIHGIAANRYNFDLGDERSLAMTLASHGWDVWLVELRGRGLSSRPRLFSKHRYDWCFDDYVERDLPAAAETILERTGKKALHVVGFSTGALAAYAWLTDGKRTAEVASLVSLAGPSTFKRMSNAISGQLIRSLRWMRHRWVFRTLAPLAGWLPLSLFYNSENTDGTTQRRAMVNLIANFSRNELLQYSDWILHDVFRSIDRRRDYRAELSRLTVPTLFLAGPRDALAPPDAIKATFETVGSTDKQWRLMSRAQGCKVNYGHFDLLVGRESPNEVFPAVEEWLAAHDGVGAAVEKSEVA
jgi:pimeloyl-ACP methyl ester carboxylesterase